MEKSNIEGSSSLQFPLFCPPLPSWSEEASGQWENIDKIVLSLIKPNQWSQPLLVVFGQMTQNWYCSLSPGGLWENGLLGWPFVFTWLWRYDPIPTLSSKRKQILFITLLALLAFWSWPIFFFRVSFYLLSSHDNILRCFVPLEPKIHSLCGEKE